MMSKADAKQAAEEAFHTVLGYSPNASAKILKPRLSIKSANLREKSSIQGTYLVA